MSDGSWVLLLYGLPTGCNAERVSLWRKLKQFGALALKNSAYLLPDLPAHMERFQWLAKQVRDAGGEATLIHVLQVEGLTNDEIVREFNDARARDYDELMGALTCLMARRQKQRRASFETALEKLVARFNAIRAIDYFACPRGHDAELLFKRAEALGRPKVRNDQHLDPKDFAGKTWLTRPRPEIDRVGSAWLIRKFIDPRARFVFAASPASHPEAIPYDMAEGDLTHQGEDCTFETLLKRFGIADAGARQLGEMIHDADLEDGKFQRAECVGLDRVFKGWTRLGLSDEEILTRGWECFDALYATLAH